MIFRNNNISGKLITILDSVTGYIKFHGESDPNISTSNIGRQIEHSVLAIEQVLKALNQSGKKL